MRAGEFGQPSDPSEQTSRRTRVIAPITVSWSAGPAPSAPPSGFVRRTSVPPGTRRGCVAATPVETVRLSACGRPRDECYLCFSSETHEKAGSCSSARGIPRKGHANGKAAPAVSGLFCTATLPAACGGPAACFRAPKAEVATARDPFPRVPCRFTPSGRLTVPAVILVVAATARELEWDDGVRALVCGIGPVEAAVSTARALAIEPPDAILHSASRGRAASIRRRSSSGRSPSTTLWPAGKLVPSRLVPDAGSSTPRGARCRMPSCSRSATCALVGGTTCARSRRWRDLPYSGPRLSPAFPRSSCARARTSSTSPTVGTGGSRTHCPRSIARCRASWPSSPGRNAASGPSRAARLRRRGGHRRPHPLLQLRQAPALSGHRLAAWRPPPDGSPPLHARLPRPCGVLLRERRHPQLVGTMRLPDAVGSRPLPRRSGTSRFGPRRGS